MYFLKQENGDINNDTIDETDNSLNDHYGFKTRKCPPRCSKLDQFENDMFDITNRIKFRKVADPFQNTLKNDVNDIKKSPNLLVFADKTSNL